MKGYLLDTHVFLWLVMSPERLSPAVQHTFVSLLNPLHVSAATVWEIAQKRAAKKLLFSADIVVAMATHHLLELPIRAVHCEAAAALPRHHKDPFDRLLIAQSLVEGLILATHDAAMARYDVPILRV